MPYFYNRRTGSTQTVKKLPKAKKVIDEKQNNAIVKLQKQVKKITLAEPKYKQGTFADTSVVNGTPSVFLLNGIQQGDTNLLRDGVKLRWRSLKLRIIIQSGAQVVPNFIRFILVREITALGSDVSPAQLLTSATPDVLAQYNVSTRDNSRYVVYKDSGPIVMGPDTVDYSSSTGTSTVHPMARIWNINKKFNFVTNYSRGTAGTIADIDTNSLSLLVFADTAITDGIGIFGAWTMMGTEI